MGDDHRRNTGREAASLEDHALLRRMLADADRLCASPDALLCGQAAQLRGRIAAMIEITAPPGALIDEARS